MKPRRAWLVKMALGYMRTWIVGWVGFIFFVSAWPNARLDCQSGAVLDKRALCANIPASPLPVIMSERAFESPQPRAADLHRTLSKPGTDTSFPTAQRSRVPSHEAPHYQHCKTQPIRLPSLCARPRPGRGDNL